MDEHRCGGRSLEVRVRNWCTWRGPGEEVKELVNVAEKVTVSVLTSNQNAVFTATAGPRSLGYGCREKLPMHLQPFPFAMGSSMPLGDPSRSWTCCPVVRISGRPATHATTPWFSHPLIAVALRLCDPLRAQRRDCTWERLRVQGWSG